MAQSAEGFRVRSGEVHKIDLALGTYHARSFDQHFPEKYKLLVDIYRQCMAYTFQHPGRRRGSLVVLAAQCLTVLRGTVRNLTMVIT